MPRARSLRARAYRPDSGFAPRARRRASATVARAGSYARGRVAANAGPTLNQHLSGFHAKTLDHQLAFIRELDKLKSVSRRISLIDRSRLENSAEHSWHLGTMAVVLAEYAPEGADVGRVVEMLLVHDVVEIDAGDTFAFDAAANVGKAERETVAADRLFGLLPDDGGRRLRELWDEFEEGETPAARFANALDRLQGLLMNDAPGDGGTWRIHGVTSTQVLARMAPIQSGAPALWPIVLDAVEHAVAAGHIRDDRG